MNKSEALAVYQAHAYGIEVPIEKLVDAVQVLSKEGVLVR